VTFLLQLDILTVFDAFYVYVDIHVGEFCVVGVVLCAMCLEDVN
jgi:hypothetical protein